MFLLYCTDNVMQSLLDGGILLAWTKKTITDVAVESKLRASAALVLANLARNGNHRVFTSLCHLHILHPFSFLSFVHLLCARWFGNVASDSNCDLLIKDGFLSVLSDILQLPANEEVCHTCVHNWFNQNRCDIRKLIEGGIAALEYECYYAKLADTCILWTLGPSITAYFFCYNIWLYNSNEQHSCNECTFRQLLLLVWLPHVPVLDLPPSP